MKYLLVHLFVLGLTRLQAQEATITTGSNASGSGGSVSYSIGQMVYTTNTGINGSMAQGVQQPFEISLVTGLEEAEGISLQCSVYPNPTTDYLVLKVENFDKENLSYQLIDINGKPIENKNITGNETNIIMSDLVPATYFLKVTLNNKEVKTFKIVKN
jgi:hypothetical protein